MGFENANQVRDEVADLTSMGWEALGQVVQLRALDAVANHFLTVGLVEICFEALNDSGRLEELEAVLAPLVEGREEASETTHRHGVIPGADRP